MKTKAKGLIASALTWMAAKRKKLLDRLDAWEYTRQYNRGQRWAEQQLAEGKTTTSKIIAECYVPTAFSGSYAFDQGAYRTALHWKGRV